MEVFLVDNLSLFLEKGIDSYHVKVDLNKNGFGYVLYVGSPEKGLLVGLNSKSSLEDSNSFLGKLRAIFGLCKIPRDSHKISM